ncbi:L-rhamnose-binding lectin CSL3-like [Hydra vulgaris]|uniref:L-rhamnose-binding lectin CSL3-like n=1 Tax=Hydra vulgaris TaxID=6087 RepID=A0ABM4CUH3_HYDVU
MDTTVFNLIPFYNHMQSKVQVHVTRACEWYNLKVVCDSYKVIEVLYANYGRTLSNICPGAQSSNTKCKPPVHVAQACEGSSLKISCNGHGVINVLNANYGRKLSDICPGAQSSNIICYNQAKSLAVIRNSCSGRSSCTIQATNAILGDPCVGTYKYLEIIKRVFSSSIPQVNVVHACEGNNLRIDCNGNGNTKILQANYGTTLSYVCPGVTHVHCSGKSSCTIAASNAVFGDPCVGTYKHLEVLNRCY